MAFRKAGQPPTEPLGRNPNNALDRGYFLIRLGHDPTLGDHTVRRHQARKWTNPRACDIKDVGREDKSGARGFGCWLWISRAACGSVLHVPNGG